MNFLYFCTGWLSFQCGLMDSVNQHLENAYRPRSRLAYKNCFRIFLAFMAFVGRSVFQIADQDILMFVQMLAFNNLAFPSFLNYISALKFQFQWHNLPLACLKNFKLSLLLRSLKVNIRRLPRGKGIFDISTLKAICSACDVAPLGHVYKLIFLLVFFAFFRLSNLVPPVPLEFDLSRHLCRGDVLVDHQGATIIIKWSKTRQASSQHTVVRVPCLGTSPLCPIQVFRTLVASIPAPKNAALFCIPPRLLPLSQSNVRNFLSNVLRSIGVDPSSHTFHCFRRSGATFAFNHHLPIQAIKSHGTWTSEAVQAYIASDLKHTSSVASSVQHHLLTT